MAVYQFEINDDANNALADITAISYDKTLSARLSRPLTAGFKVPLAGVMANSLQISTLLLPDHGDGFPTLHAGPNRRLKIRRDGVIVANLFITRVDRGGDENQTWAEAFCADPMIAWQSRWVRDAAGSIVQGPGTMGFPTPVSGGDLIAQVINNSVAYDTTIWLDTSEGTFDAAIPPAVDLAFVLENWPIRIGDLATRLTETGCVDVTIAPVDTGGGFSDDIMGVLSAVNQAGADLSGTVNFDYAAGDYTIRAVRHTYDMATLATRLWYYLGPRRSPTRWKGNITRDAPGTTTDPDPFVTLYGVWHDIRIFDDGENKENDQRPLFTALWNTEQQLRMRPREQLHITPSAGAAPGKPAPPAPFADFNLGDIVTVNIGAALGTTLLSANQRIYGFDITVTSDGVEQVGELHCSADGE